MDGRSDRTDGERNQTTQDDVGPNRLGCEVDEQVDRRTSSSAMCQDKGGG